ncbi:MAG TPA: hypothetical protein VLE44_01175 [Candidatus Saccharimonadales bacterium]|nr:hypothetical protein [Candidatus Saccharimonadales bacterium]
MNKKEKFDISKKVMKGVVNFERKRSTTRLLEIVLPIFGAILIASGFFYFSAKVVIEQGSLDVFSLFGEDFEIVKDYWKDTLSTFWQELPQGEIFAGLLFLIIAIIIFVVFRKRIKVMIKRLINLRKIK